MLLVLLVRGLTLPGVLQGIKFYVYPDFNRLLDPKALQLTWPGIHRLSTGSGCETSASAVGRMLLHYAHSPVCGRRGILTAVTDMFPRVLRRAGRSELFLLFFCLFAFCYNLIMVTEVNIKPCYYKGAIQKLGTTFRERKRIDIRKWDRGKETVHFGTWFYLFANLPGVHVETFTAG
ncbi:hypothetical protein AOLI_G00100430 [Acnodon oligacanthus]